MYIIYFITLTTYLNRVEGASPLNPVRSGVFLFVKILPLDGVSHDYVGLFGGQPSIVNPSSSGDR